MIGSYFLQRAWDDCGMNGKDIDPGIAGSLTMLFLTIAVTLLLVNFYRRYQRMQKREEGTERVDEQ